tara:strand:- start:140 stop:508 length:369 start_codon:yes stop_codon:yes gene_type:complete
MRSTFTEYKETQQAREDIAAAVLKHTHSLCRALEQNFKQRHPNNDPYTFSIETGRKYHKILMETESQSQSVHAFVDKKTGEVYKAASYKSPAKGVRFDLRIIEQREWLFDNADWAGSYLYIR